MLHLSDSELDKLASNASENHEAIGAVPDWEKIELLLKQHMPVKKEPRRRIFFILLALFLLLGGSYFYFANDNNIKPTIKSTIATYATSKNTPVNPGGSVAISTPPGSNLPTTKSINTDPVQNKQGQSANLPVRDKNISGQPPVSLHKQLSVHGKNAGIASMAINSNEPQEINTIAQEKKIQAVNIPGEKAGSITITDDPSIKQAKTGTVNPVSDKPKNTLTVADEKKVTTSKKAPGSKINTKSKYKKNFDISLVYAPELTTVRFTHTDKLGSNYGFLVGYNIIRNISVRTGLINSRKNYTAAGKDFTLNYPPPPGYKLNNASGYCKMVELPLNIKYQFSGTDKVKFFVTAGLSSYFMKSEYYTINFKNDYYARDITHTYNTQRNYWFSVADLEAGIEKQISKKLFIAASPFMKVPLTGMGEGKLKLQGAGILFFVTYKTARQK